jgi:hypothetical protein
MEDAMARGCWTAVLIVVVVIVGLAVVFGPTIYREGRAVAGPVVELARSEGALEDLDAEFPFDPPSGDAEVTEGRLLEFLAVRRELRPLYAEWQNTVKVVEREHGDSWRGAKVVLAETRDTMTGQIAALRDAQMSPSEFLWLEDIVYQRWRNPQDDAEHRARREVVRELTEEDLNMVSGLERRHGSSPALRELRSRLDDRLAATEDGGPVSVPGISPETQELFWHHREQIDELDLAGYELHHALDRRGGTTITIGDHRRHLDD